MKQTLRYMGVRVSHEPILPTDPLAIAVKDKLVGTLGSVSDRLSGAEAYLYRVRYEFADEHFGVEGIENRVSSIKLSTKINPKQSSTGRMSLCNHLLPASEFPAGVTGSLSPRENGFSLSPTYFVHQGAFEDHVLIVVKAEVQEKDRKVAWSVVILPTAGFSQRLANAKSACTKGQFKLARTHSLI